MLANGLELCSVVELRRYALHPGTVADLLRIFEWRLIEAQEQTGMVIAGTFRDEDDPNAFVWLRGFSGHEQRTAALSAFYGGPVWARNAAAANATMVDSDDVLLLRPIDPPSPPQPAVERSDADAAPAEHRLALEVLAVPRGLAGDAAERWFASVGAAALEEAMSVPVAAWRTDSTPNGFPRLPIRNDRVVVWSASFADERSRAQALASIDRSSLGHELSARAVSRRRMLLQPTARSAHPDPVQRRSEAAL